MQCDLHHTWMLFLGLLINVILFFTYSLEQQCYSVLTDILSAGAEVWSEAR